MGNKTCPYCGAEIDTEAKKCKFCGEWVKDEENFPEELKHFNWGAFLMNWIWGLMHRKYITLLYFVACLIPILGPIAISIWFGIKGNRWAWKSKNWQSIEEFNKTQQDYIFIWTILFILGLIFAVKIFLFFFIIGKIET